MEHSCIHQWSLDKAGGERRGILASFGSPSPDPFSAANPSCRFLALMKLAMVCSDVPLMQLYPFIMNTTVTSSLSMATSPCQRVTVYDMMTTYIRASINIEH